MPVNNQSILTTVPQAMPSKQEEQKENIVIDGSVFLHETPIHMLCILEIMFVNSCRSSSIPTGVRIKVTKSLLKNLPKEKNINIPLSY